MKDLRSPAIIIDFTFQNTRAAMKYIYSMPQFEATDLLSTLQNHVYTNEYKWAIVIHLLD